MMHYVQTTNRNVKEYSQGSHLIILYVFTWWLAASDTSIHRRDFENRRKASIRIRFVTTEVQTEDQISTVSARDN